MAGWQSYVDGTLVGSKRLTRAAIIGFQDKAVWATSPSFTLKPEEVTALLAAFRDPTNIRASGLWLAGVKYFALRCDERSIYSKVGEAGAVCVKANSVVLVGIYDAKIKPTEAATVVEKLADFLIESGSA